MDLTALDVSSSLGLAAMYLLTVNILLGLLISTRYNPVRQWPRKRVNIFRLHNWNAYLAVAVAASHPAVLLLSQTAGFGIWDVIWPEHSPGQRNYNWLGAISFYLLLFVVITSLFRNRIGHRRWKPLHYAAYAMAWFVFTHGLLIDPKIKNEPTDFLDGEKIQVELCAALVVAATAWRIRIGRARRNSTAHT